jgi:hypothetical protein
MEQDFQVPWRIVKIKQVKNASNQKQLGAYTMILLNKYKTK